METMLHPPRTALELFKLLPEGTLCQLIHNKIVMSPSAKWKHQDVAGLIFTEMKIYLRKNPVGKILSDVDVYLDEENVYRPDIMLIGNHQMELLGKDGYVHGAPELVIEILSQSTAKNDRIEKKEIYERYGVKEYWLIEPDSLQCEGFVNENNLFITASCFTKRIYHSFVTTYYPSGCLKSF